MRSQLDVALDLMAECQEAKDTANLAATVLARLPELIPCESSSWNRMPGPTSSEVLFVLCEPVEIVVPGAEDILAAHSGEHPLIGHYRRTGDGQALQMSDFISRRQLHDMALYTDLYRGLGVEAQVSCAVPLGDEGFIGIALSRSGSDFTERDKKILDLLRPHVVEAYRRVAPWSGATARRSAAHRFGLTDREAEVLDAVCTGATNLQVARRLGLSPRTVQKHLGSVFTKMGVQTRTAAAALAREPEHATGAPQVR